jgi:hypothetical protein
MNKNLKLNSYEYFIPLFVKDYKEEEKNQSVIIFHLAEFIIEML